MLVKKPEKKKTNKPEYRPNSYNNNCCDKSAIFITVVAFCWVPVACQPAKWSKSRIWEREAIEIDGWLIHIGKGASDPEGACQPVSQSMLLLLLPLFAGPFCIWRDFYMKITNYWQQARDYFSCVGCAAVLYFFFFFFFGHHRGRGWHMPKTAKIVSPIGGGTCIWIQ